MCALLSSCRFILYISPFVTFPFLISDCYEEVSGARLDSGGHVMFCEVVALVYFSYVTGISNYLLCFLVAHF